jgi:hypothetical protein
MPVSMFENKPQRCPYGHQLWPGKAQVSWTPCVCEPAREAAGRGRGMGHVRVTCNRCHDELRQTLFYEPPHDIGHRPLTGWTSSPPLPSLHHRVVDAIGRKWHHWGRCLCRPCGHYAEFRLEVAAVLVRLSCAFRLVGEDDER